MTRSHRTSGMVRTLALVGTFAATAATLTVGLVAPASPAFADDTLTVTIDHFYRYDPFDLSVTSSETVDALKSQIADETGPDNSADRCLVHDEVAMQPGTLVSDYGIQSGDVIEVFEMPMQRFGRWNITPDEPFLGNTVGMITISHPMPTHVELIDGKLPHGVSLDTATGALSGTFDRLGPFTATFRATTICGDWTITWSGDVYNDLPPTGFDATPAIIIGASGVAVVALGITGVVLWRRRASNASRASR